MTTKMKWMMTALLVAGCSAEPDGAEEEPLVIYTQSDAGSDASLVDAGATTEDTSTPDSSADVDATVEPDVAGLADVGQLDMSMPDAGPDGTVCQTKDAPVQLINTCTFEWSDCSDGSDYAFECNIQNVGGMAFSLCNCFENGVMDPEDTIVDICGLSDWGEVEAIVNEQCGWDLQ